MELGVQHLVLDATLVQHARELLGALDRDRTNKHRLAFGVALLDIVCNGLELVLDGAVDAVIVVDALYLLVGRNLNDRQLVDLAELGVLCHGGTRHAGELVVEAEVVLQRDGCERLVLLANKHALLGLHGLVQALRPTTTLHDAASELVDDLDLAVHHDIVLVAVEHVLRLQRLLKVVGKLTGEVGIDLRSQALLNLAKTLVRGGNRVLCLVHDVVAVGLGHRAAQRVALRLLGTGEAANRASELLVGIGRLRAGTGDDERRASLVNENRVDLVHDGKAVATLHAHVGPRDHVVAQVVKAKLRVGAVGHVRGVRGALVLQGHAVLQQANLHAEELVQLAHPFRVTTGQVIVDGDDVNALARKGVEVAGERRHERLALAGLHLGDHATVQRNGADDLDIKVTHAKHAIRGLASRSKRLGKQAVQRLAVGIALLHECRLIRELLVRHLCVLRSKGVDLVGYRLELLELLVGANGENLGKKTWHGRTSKTSRGQVDR